MLFRSLNKNEVIFTERMPIKPSWVNGYAGHVWERLAETLFNQGLLCHLDTDLFAGYCILVKDYRDAVTAGNTNLQIKIISELRKYAHIFGCTPAGRAERLGA